jgi:hypothetical protein
MSIEFTDGFTIIPNSGNPPAGPGDYYLIADYRPALFNGNITIPDHPNATFSLDFNIVGGVYGAGLYINLNDTLGTDNSTYLTQLVGNHTHLTFYQGSYHITFDCEIGAWFAASNQVAYDPTQGSSPDNSMSIISTSGQPFNLVDPITIGIIII